MTLTHIDYKDEKCEASRIGDCRCAERALAQFQASNLKWFEEAKKANAEAQQAQELTEAWVERFTRLSAQFHDELKEAREERDALKTELEKVIALRPQLEQMQADLRQIRDFRDAQAMKIQIQSDALVQAQATIARQRESLQDYADTNTTDKEEIARLKANDKEFAGAMNEALRENGALRAQIARLVEATREYLDASSALRIVDGQISSDKALSLGALEKLLTDITKENNLKQ